MHLPFSFFNFAIDEKSHAELESDDIPLSGLKSETIDIILRSFIFQLYLQILYFKHYSTFYYRTIANHRLKSKKMSQM